MSKLEKTIFIVEMCQHVPEEIRIRDISLFKCFVIFDNIRAYTLRG
jgi:hypothetical protein